MQQGRIASADENSALRFFERWGVAFLRFLGDVFALLLGFAWQLSSLSWLRIEKRVWAGKHESWTCNKQRAIPTGETELQAMNDADIAELRAPGEDLGGFVDRWIYACSRDHMRKVLGR